MLTLGVDTSEPIGGVALFEEGRMAETLWMDAPLTHAECLFPLIEEILKIGKVDRRQLGLVSVNRGPGSFTGLRIGLAAMKGFCQATGIPLVGVDGTLVYRQRIPECQRVCVVLANRGRLVYVRWFGGSRPKGPAEAMHETELLSRLAREERELCLVGSAAPALMERLRFASAVRIAPEEANRPSPLAVARWGCESYSADQLYSVEPLYVEPLLLGGKAV